MVISNRKYPKEGYRFELYENQYDVTALISNNVRFSSVKGGKIYNIHIDDFINKIETQEIKYIEAPYYPLLDDSNYAVINRKKRYIEAVLPLEHMFSHRVVKEIIEKIAIDIDDKTPPSSRTVMRWVNNFNKEESFLGNFKQNTGNCSLRLAPEIENILSHGIHEYFLKPREIRSAKDVLAYITNEFLDKNITSPLPSLRTIQRRIKKLDPYQVYRHKKGIRAANQHFQAAGKQCSSPFIMNKIEIDSHLLDVVILDDNTLEDLGRPILTCAIDVFSRCIVGWNLSVLPPNIDNTINLLKDMFTRPQRNLPGGIPDYIIPDNGVEFKNNTLSYICENRKITILPSQKYTPNNKPHIERFFRTLTLSFSQKLKGTTFSNPSARGEYNAKKNSALTFSNLSDALHDWIEDIYHQSPHDGIGRRIPIVYWNEYIKKTPVISMSKDEVDILIRLPKKRIINNGRIQFNHLTYYSHVLTNERFNKKSVTILIDRTNLIKIYVRDPENKNNFIIADSTNPMYTKDLSLYEHLCAQEEKKALSQKDRRLLGENADFYARWKLLNKIQDAYANNKKLKKLKLETPSKVKNLLNSISTPLPTHSEVRDLPTNHQAMEIMDEHISALSPNSNVFSNNDFMLTDDEDSEYESMTI